jgi:hypothetical protein
MRSIAWLELSVRCVASWLPVRLALAAAKSGVFCRAMGYVVGSLNPKSGRQHRGGSVYSGIAQVDLDAAELRDWVSDDVELGRRVADDFVEAGAPKDRVELAQQVGERLVP